MVVVLPFFDDNSNPFKAMLTEFFALLQGQNGIKNMQHILDNPIWNALSTNNRALAIGDDNTSVLKPDIGAFAGMRDNSVVNLMGLYMKTPLETPLVLFVPTEISIPGEWQVLVKKPLLQMVYAHKEPPMAKVDVVALSEKDIEAMLSLTALTEPGPFLKRTIDFGNYQGIFANEKLVAMAGQRLHAGPYIEISAVCTHPDHLGNGYAGMLVGNQIHNILERSCIPFLHVLPDNKAAYSLYLKLGFEVRKEMLCYVIKKEAQV